MILWAQISLPTRSDLRESSAPKKCPREKLHIAMGKSIAAGVGHLVCNIVLPSPFTCCSGSDGLDLQVRPHPICPLETGTVAKTE